MELRPRWLLLGAAIVIGWPCRAADITAFDQLLDSASAAEAPKTPRIDAKNPAPAIDNPWGRVSTPTSDSPQTIGGYSAGCIKGAQTLNSNFPDFQVMRPKRNRFFGHPSLVAFLKDLGKRAHKKGLQTVLFGDMSQPRGGPLMSGHASHQTGLDVDVWLWQPQKGKELSLEERNNFSAPQMVKLDFEGLTRNWKPKYIDVLKLAAEDPNVQRVLVNPVVKREVCKVHKGEDWIHKLRPWWAHTEHFHVRLKCPDNDALCQHQEDVPPGDGCDDTLDHWFTPEVKAKSRDMRLHPGPPTMPVLPDACQALLQEPAIASGAAAK